MDAKTGQFPENIDSATNRHKLALWTMNTRIAIFWCILTSYQVKCLWSFFKIFSRMYFEFYCVHFIEEKNILLCAHVSTVSHEFNSSTVIKTFVPAFIAPKKETTKKFKYRIEYIDSS